jgi:agmatine deiminase
MVNVMLSRQKSSRLPAEWERQDAILLAWPHNHTDWADMLDQVEQVYLEITRQITRFESVIIVSPTPETVQLKLKEEAVDLSNILFLQADTDDTWARDFGPLTVHNGQELTQLDFTFNGWGHKFPAENDNKVTEKLNQSEIVKPNQRQKIDLVLEGGSIEVDGHGTLLTTSQCLLNQNRNPDLTLEEIEKQLSQYFDINHFLWLNHGCLAGDDTDAHIDTVARLCPDSTILYVQCNQPDDEHFLQFKKMEEQLKSFKDQNGHSFRLLPLPWPKACYNEDERLPATYANYLVINGAVLVPIYQDSADEQALKTVKQAFPDREIIGIECLPLIKQHGSLHCITMQFPAGVLA